MTDYTGITGIDRLLDEAEEATDPRGNPMRQLLIPGDRYRFDFNLDLGEWQQFDTDNDASYFGVWVNKTTLRTLQFIEGDLYLTQCADAAAYDAEIAALCSFYTAASAFVAIGETGTTAYYQDRAQFFIEPARGAAGPGAGAADDEAGADPTAPA